MDLSFFGWSQQIIERFGYLGIFFINLISSSTILFPIPGYIFIFIFGGILNPAFVALFSSLGAALGELTAYGVGRGGGYILKKSQKKYFEKGKEWFSRGRGFWVIILFAATPLPFDVIGISAGLFNYNLQRFILATFLGKILKYSALAFGGFYGINWILNILKYGF